jgi:hypothetical protein
VEVSSPKDGGAGGGSEKGRRAGAGMEEDVEMEIMGVEGVVETGGEKELEE